MDAPEKKKKSAWTKAKACKAKEGHVSYVSVRPMKPALIRKEFMFALIVNLSVL